MDTAIRDALNRVIDLYATRTIEKPTFGFIISDGRFLDLGTYYDGHTDMYIDLLIRRNIDHPEGRRLVSSGEEQEQSWKLDDELAPLLGIRYNSGLMEDPRRYFVVNGKITDSQKISLEKWLVTLGHKCVEGYCGKHYYLFDLRNTSPNDIIDTLKVSLSYGDNGFTEGITERNLAETKGVRASGITAIGEGKERSSSTSDGMSIFVQLMEDHSFSGSDGYYSFSFSDTPTERCFILPSGRCVLLPESLENTAHYRPHYIVDDWIYYTIIKGDKKENHFPEWMDDSSFSKMKAWLESVTPSTGEKVSGCPALKAIGAIRVNGYRERFIDLPDKPITEPQKSVLGGWLDRFFTRGRPNIEVDLKSSYVTYHYSIDTGTDYIMDRIGRAYSYGKLEESVSSPSDVDDYLMKLNGQTGARELTGAEYVMPDGRLLDVSALNSDTKEHEGVWEQIHSKWNSIDGEDWCLRNLIRLSYTGLWIPEKMTDEQRKVLVRICDEFDDPKSVMARDMLNPFTDDGRNDARILSVYLPPDWTHGQKADMVIVSGGELYKRIMKAVSDGTGILSESIGKDKEDDENPGLSTIEAIRRMRL